VFLGKAEIGIRIVCRHTLPHVLPQISESAPGFSGNPSITPRTCPSPLLACPRRMPERAPKTRLRGASNSLPCGRTIPGYLPEIATLRRALAFFAHVPGECPDVPRKLGCAVHQIHSHAAGQFPDMYWKSRCFYVPHVPVARVLTNSRTCPEIPECCTTSLPRALSALLPSVN
jgi:hypothetical protein